MSDIDYEEEFEDQEYEESIEESQQYNLVNFFTHSNRIE